MNLQIKVHIMQHIVRMMQYTRTDSRTQNKRQLQIVSR